MDNHPMEATQLAMMTSQYLQFLEQRAFPLCPAPPEHSKKANLPPKPEGKFPRRSLILLVSPKDLCQVSTWDKLPGSI